jgi:hypothetical protein
MNLSPPLNIGQRYRIERPSKGNKKRVLSGIYEVSAVYAQVTWSKKGLREPKDYLVEFSMIDENDITYTLTARWRSGAFYHPYNHKELLNWRISKIQ